MTNGKTSRMIVVLRPGEAGAALVTALYEAGYAACHLPTLEILTVAADLPAGPFDHYIFISPTAVSMSFMIRPDWLPLNCQPIAVGSGTAKALAKHGHADAIIPQTYNSEGLLALPELNEVSGKRILIIKGEGGRKLLQDTLLTRGADCLTWSVYRRQPVTIAARQWQPLKEASAWLLTCASIETLDAFEQQRQVQQLTRPEQIFVASDRIADHAKRLGYTGIILAGGATNAHFETAISHYLANG